MGLTSQDQILFVWFHDYEGSNDYCPKFMILKDEISKSIVLTVRGTWEPKDVISKFSKVTVFYCLIIEKIQIKKEPFFPRLWGYWGILTIYFKIFA